MLSNCRNFQALCNFFCACNDTRTRVKKLLVPQKLYVCQIALTQKPHIVRISLHYFIHSLPKIFAFR